jgi:hypothetical protein
MRASAAADHDLFQISRQEGRRGHGGRWGLMRLVGANNIGRTAFSAETHSRRADNFPLEEGVRGCGFGREKRGKQMHRRQSRGFQARPS